jgi:hypothetical protein
MSRGLGIIQRRVLDVLYQGSSDDGMPVVELKASLNVDRSNARRSIRALMQRELLEELIVGGERRVQLTYIGAMWAMPPLPEQPDPHAELRVMREAEDQMRNLIKERASLEAQKEASWIHYVHHPIRRRQPGPTQKQVLAVLWEYAEPADEGLPVRVVKAIVGGDRSNTRRAIRSLLLRGEVEESEDAQSIRLASGTALWFSIIPPVLLEPIDEERARAILRTFRNSQVVA